MFEHTASVGVTWVSKDSRIGVIVRYEDQDTIFRSTNQDAVIFYHFLFWHTIRIFPISSDVFMDVFHYFDEIDYSDLNKPKKK